MTTNQSTVFEIPSAPLVPVIGHDAAYPVHRVFCVGRNYEAHAIEMGVAVDREAPFYFTKAPSAIVHSGATVPYPTGTENYHYEMELVFVIGKPAFRVSVEDAMEHVFGYATGLDMTRRDLQLVAREKGRPWDLGKDFEKSAVISAITPSADFATSHDAMASKRITLQVDGETRQESELANLIWKVPEIVSHLSGFYHLAPGDVIYTGTPAGVGAVQTGAVIHGEVDGLEPVDLTIGPAE